MSGQVHNFGSEIGLARSCQVAEVSCRSPGKGLSPRAHRRGFKPNVANSEMSTRVADDQDQAAPSGPNKKPRINSPGRVWERILKRHSSGSTFAEAGGDATAGDDDDDEEQCKIRRKMMKTRML